MFVWLQSIYIYKFKIKTSIPQSSEFTYMSSLFFFLIEFIKQNLCIDTSNSEEIIQNIQYLMFFCKILITYITITL